MKEREAFSTRLGFILTSAGCAIGLGNIWRFPFVTGKYGGGGFVLLYLIFLAIFGIPVVIMEFSVGRASQKSIAQSFHILEPPGSKWHLFSYVAMVGNYLLMMFYTTISGWMLAYFFYMLRGDFVNKNPADIEILFENLIANPLTCIFFMIIICAIGFGVCALGLQKGVEKITKVMMLAMFILIFILVIRAITLPNALAGLDFYLRPDFSKIRDEGVWNTIYAAMGQSFFTLSIGMGNMALFGSYIGKKRRLLGEGVCVTALDTSVAILSGLIIFPACFSFGVNPGSGPGLVFVTLPNIFNSMSLGQLWGALFFAFMTFAAFSTVIAVFENIIAFAIDLTGCSRKKSALLNFFAIVLLSLPCALGFNVLSNISPLGEGTTILDFEDFIVSNNILPIGSLVFLLFCVTRYGWGWDKFIEEVNIGSGMKLPEKMRFYLTYVLPVVVIIIFIFGYIEIFS